MKYYHEILHVGFYKECRAISFCNRKSLCGGEVEPSTRYNMKIGIISRFQDCNDCGEILQYYALQEAIKSLGNTVEIIDYSCFCEPIETPTEPFFHKIERKIYQKLKKSNINYFSKENLTSFSRRNLHISRHYNKGTIIYANNEYDGFVCGCDQIWNPDYFDSNLYLAFADKSKTRISYASGFGNGSISVTVLRKVEPLIKSLSAVSVEQRNIAETLHTNGVDVCKAINPILLWNESFWDSIISGKEDSKQKYVLCYFTEDSDSNQKQIKSITKSKKIKTILIEGEKNSRTKEYNYADEILYDVSPERLIGLIKRSSFVISDSFHICALSTIYNVPFFVFESSFDNNPKGNKLMLLDFIDMLEMKSHIVKNPGKIQSMLAQKFSINNFLLEEMREKSWDYLKSSLSTNAEGCSNCKIYEYPIGVYAGQCKDIRIRKNSSSGGIFYLLAKEVLSKNGIVIACRLDQNGKAIHDICCSINELSEYMTSKYVQSEMREMFRVAGENLLTGNHVLFVGTPCQVAGLLRYLKIKKIQTNQLLCVDFFCHGVPSPFVWSEYLKSLMHGNISSLQHVNFRHKEYGWRNFSMCIEMKDSNRYLKDISHDEYLRGFMKNAFLRPSCYRCRYKMIKHDSDITIGDFWHFDENKSSIADDNTGVSLIVAQSVKGENAILSLKNQLTMDSLSPETIFEATLASCVVPEVSDLRTRFFKEYNLFCNKYGRNKMNEYLKKQLKESFSLRIIKVVNRILRR